jgi:hypothetical protein
MRKMILYKCEHCDIDPNVAYTILELENMGYEIFDATPQNNIHKSFFADFVMPMTVLKAEYDNQKIQQDYSLESIPELTEWNNDYVVYQSDGNRVVLHHDEHKKYQVLKPHSCWVVKTSILADLNKNKNIFDAFHRYYSKNYGIYPPCNICLALSLADVNFLENCGVKELEHYSCDDATKLYTIIW